MILFKKKSGVGLKNKIWASGHCGFWALGVAQWWSVPARHGQTSLGSVPSTAKSPAPKKKKQKQKNNPNCY